MGESGPTTLCNAGDSVCLAIRRVLRDVVDRLVVLHRDLQGSPRWSGRHGRGCRTSCREEDCRYGAVEGVQDHRRKVLGQQPLLQSCMT